MSKPPQATAPINAQQPPLYPANDLAPGLTTFPFEAEPKVLRRPLVEPHRLESTLRAPVLAIPDQYGAPF